MKDQRKVNRLWMKQKRINDLLLFKLISNKTVMKYWHMGGMIFWIYYIYN